MKNITIFIIIFYCCISCGNTKNKVVKDSDVTIDTSYTDMAYIKYKNDVDSFYPRKFNDTIRYYGSMHYIQPNINYDTSYSDTLSVVRFCCDSIMFCFNKPTYTDVLYPTVTDSLIFLPAYSSHHIDHNFYEVSYEGKRIISKTMFLFFKMDSMLLQSISLYRSNGMKVQFYFKGSKRIKYN